MKIIEQYQCEICQKTYDLKTDALNCESIGIIKSKFNAGDTVYLIQRYPNNPKKPFVKRILISKYQNGHYEEWELDKTVQVGKSLTVGWSQRVAQGSWRYPEDEYHGAIDNIFCCEFGKAYEGVLESYVLTEDAIDYDEESH